MAEFVKENKKENIQKKEEVKKEDKICVISIASGNPYDSSQLVNDENIFYTNINYQQLKELYEHLKKGTESENMMYKNILNNIRDRKSKVFFDFKCCSHCCSGEKFTDNDTTLLVFKLINTMTKRRCNIIVGDHSMAALFNNWDRYRMDMKCPIKIVSDTSGPYKMTGKKEDFLNSIHPILKNLGDMSSEDKLNIEFSNMSGTKVYEIIEEFKDKVKVISTGHTLNGRRDSEQKEEPVHCEFKYREGLIIVSATHWCNLTEVNSAVDVDKLKTQYTRQYGKEACDDFDKEYQKAVQSGCQRSVQRVVSDSVRYVCSAVPTPNSYQTKENKNENIGILEQKKKYLEMQKEKEKHKQKELYEQNKKELQEIKEKAEKEYLEHMKKLEEEENNQNDD